jgi:protein arginine N-methyltransferase 2
MRCVQAIQRRKPRSHTIVEAHPDVYARMLAQGWDKRPGVRIVFGRWQDVLPQLGQYDGIFWDTYGEYYEEMR